MFLRRKSAMVAKVGCLGRQDSFRFSALYRGGALGFKVSHPVLHTLQL